ncbi:hypothetical protein AgCh_032542 [Apium graveolens]
MSTETSESNENKMEGSHMTTEKDKKALEYLEYVTANADEIQKQVLAEILTQNAGVEYLQRHGLGGHTDSNSFKKFVPVITYEDIQPDINRIAYGDKSPILCSYPISDFFTSSGTSGGERKLIPTIEEEHGRKSAFHGLLMPVMNKYIPGLDKGKAMHFMFTKPGFKTPGGLMARSALTSLYQSKHFINRSVKDDPYTNYTSPNETILCPDIYQSMYSQMLCGLCLRDEVNRVGAPFGSGLIRSIQFLENNWPVLCKDIRTGTLNLEITDNSVRKSVLTEILKPDPVLADLIEAECSKKSWKGIITRLWPNTKCIQAIVTGSMSQYIPTLEYYGNGLPLVSPVYASSECLFGLNLDPLCKPNEVSYTPIPTMAFFEFLPVSKTNMVGDISSCIAERSLINEKIQQQLVDLVDVKLGEEYELVVTTYAGKLILRKKNFNHYLILITY